MKLNLREKISLLNSARGNYLTTRNKPLSLIVCCVLFVLFAFAQPVIAFFILVAYGLVFVFAMQGRQVQVELSDGTKDKAADTRSHNNDLKNDRQEFKTKN